MNSLDPAIKTVWSIMLMIRGMTLTAIVAAVEFIVVLPNFDDWILPVGTLSIATFVFFTIFAIVYPPLRYRFWKFEVRPQEIYLERGIITRIKTIAPFTRIQHIDVRRHILERLNGLASLVVYTAGTRGADILIPGLPVDYAEALRDRLKNYSPDDAV